jgi:hypothetical protein
MRISYYETRLRALENIEKEVEKLRETLAGVRPLYDDEGDIVALIEGSSVSFRDEEISFDFLRRVYHEILEKDAAPAATEAITKTDEPTNDPAPITDILAARKWTSRIQYGDILYVHECPYDQSSPAHKIVVSEKIGRVRETIARKSQNRKVLEVRLCRGINFHSSIWLGGQKG